MTRIAYIRCARCFKLGEIHNKFIPQRCPVCGNKFNKHVDGENILDMIYTLLFNKNQKGYIECDHLGFTTDEALRPPEETIW